MAYAPFDPDQFDPDQFDLRHSTRSLRQSESATALLIKILKG
jgi:hypothetical protein